MGVGHALLVSRFELFVHCHELVLILGLLGQLHVQLYAFHIKALDQVLELFVLVVGLFGGVDAQVALVLLDGFAQLSCHGDNIHCLVPPVWVKYRVYARGFIPTHPRRARMGRMVVGRRPRLPAWSAGRG